MNCDAYINIIMQQFHAQFYQQEQFRVTQLNWWSVCWRYMHDNTWVSIWWKYAGGPRSVYSPSNLLGRSYSLILSYRPSLPLPTIWSFTFCIDHFQYCSFPSLVPRLFPPPVFDCLQYVYAYCKVSKTGGGNSLGMRLQFSSLFGLISRDFAMHVSNLITSSMQITYRK